MRSFSRLVNSASEERGLRLGLGPAMLMLFSAPLGAYAQKDADRNIVEGPGLQAGDFSLFKIFRISENSRVEFRTEFFNFPNHANFTLPSRGSKRLGSGKFGFVTAARAPRQIQFGLKLYF